MKTSFRILALLCALVMLMSCFVGCNKKKEDDPAATTVATTGEGEKGIEFSLPDTDWGGEECHVLGHQAGNDNSTPQFENLEIWREDVADDVVGKAVWERNLLLKDKFNFVVNQKLVGSVKAEMANVFGSGQDLYDFCIYRPFDAAKHAEEENLIDLSTVEYIDLEHPSWDQNATAQLSIGNSVYFTVSDFLIQDKDRTEILFYNREMARQAGKPLFEDLVKSGDWTVAYFGELVKEFTKDGNGNQQAGDYKADGTGDYFGLGLPGYDSFATFAFGAGVKLSELDDNGTITIINEQEKVGNIIGELGKFLFDKSQTLYVNDIVPVDYKAHCQLFSWQKMMFCSDVLSSLDRIHEGEPMASMIDFEYSFLPHPKYEAGMDTWYTSTPSGTTGAVIAIPITVEDPEKSGFFIQALSEASTSTSLFAFMEQKCKIQNAYDPLAAEMLDIVFDCIRYDIASMYDMGKLSTMLDSFPMIKRNNFEKTFQQRYEAACIAAENLMDKFA
jgi:hypothetical protein